jgi:magnesium chelatase subunit I
VNPPREQRVSASGAKTLAELRESGYRSRSVREEMRSNLVARLGRGEPLFPEMIGYEETVIPLLEHALLAGHDMIFLGERGQGKTRMIRMLTQLLDPEIPVIAGSEIHDDPLAPVSEYARHQLAEHGDATPIAWVGRDARYGEKLATPDVTIADLLGEVDPIKVAEGRYLADESTVHYGLIPRTNRGIFCINELPDLPERVQVGLFNVMEEQDFQVKGFKVRLPLDVLVVASANPEDYTRRGRIITPLKDRYQAQIRTHYPETRNLEIQVVQQERRVPGELPVDVYVPPFLTEVVGELTFQARDSSDISQASGVSVRASLANYETLVAAAERRALRLGEREAVPRVSDLQALGASMTGKIELEYAGAEQAPEQVVDKLLRRAIKVVFDEHFPAGSLDAVVEAFADGWKVEVGDQLPSPEYAEGLDNIGGLRQAIEKLGEAESPARIASAVEFILEGMHLSNLLNKEVEGRRVLYR